MRYKKLTRVFKDGIFLKEFDTRAEAAEYCGLAEITVHNLLANDKISKAGYYFVSVDTDIPMDAKPKFEIDVVKECKICGKEFHIRDPRGLSKSICSENCKSVSTRMKETEKKRRAKARAEMKALKRPKEEINVVEDRARFNGVHYGDQVAKEYMEKNKQPHLKKVDGKIVRG